tara:strand:+ start:689 stop:919 length:231 start_codon:yes stop_codon:yes gene_type:complete
MGTEKIALQIVNMIKGKDTTMVLKTAMGNVVCTIKGDPKKGTGTIEGFDELMDTLKKVGEDPLHKGDKMTLIIKPQ